MEMVMVKALDSLRFMRGRYHLLVPGSGDTPFCVLFLSYNHYIQVKIAW